MIRIGSESKGEKDKSYKMKRFKLLVKAGSDLESLEIVNVNKEGESDQHISIESNHFSGKIAVRIVGFQGFTPNNEEPIPDSPYFKDNKALNSIQIQGRFKHVMNGDDILWGNEFEKPLSLPIGASMALKIVKMTLDPTLEADLQSEKPWAFSPILVSMSTINVRVVPPQSELKLDVPWPNPDGKPLRENTSELFGGKILSDGERKKYFTKQENRKEFVVHPDHVYNFDFFNPFVDFQNFSVKMPAAGFKVNVLKYYNYQPLRYIAKTRDTGIVFFIVQLELIEVE